MKLARTHFSLFVLACVFCLASAARGQEKLERPGAGLPTFEPAPQPQGPREKAAALEKSATSGKPGLSNARITSRRVTVVALDPAKRIVTARDDAGVILERNVPPDVDLSQLRPGDKVSVKEIASVAVSVTPRSMAAPPAEPTMVVETSEPGEKPARLTVQTEELVATLASIDPTTRTVTLRNADGTTRTVEVDPRVDLDRYNAGDQVTIRVTKAFAVAVDQPQ